VSKKRGIIGEEPYLLNIEKTENSTGNEGKSRVTRGKGWWKE